MGRKNKLVSFLREKNYENVKNNPNITLYDGTASFLSGDTVKVTSDKEETVLKGKEIFINTGLPPSFYHCSQGEPEYPEPGQ